MQPRAAAAAGGQQENECDQGEFGHRPTTSAFGDGRLELIGNLCRWLSVLFAAQVPR